MRAGRGLVVALGLAACGGQQGAGDAAVAADGAGTGAGPVAGGVDGAAAPARAPLRLGWQTTWATEAQIVGALERGGFLAAQGFDATFVPFAYGAPLNEAALGGAVDVLLTADQPALVLHAKDPQWGVIGRLMVNRVGLLSPQQGGAAAPDALRGRRVAVPFGAAAHRHALATVRGAGLGSEVELVNLGIEEIGVLAAAGSAGGRWGDIDAVGAWDPTLATLEESGQARVVSLGLAVGLVVMDDRYAAKHPGAPARVLAALSSAIEAVRTDPAAADAAAIAAGLRASPSALRRAAAVEPNFAPGAGAPRMALNAAELARVREAGAFLVDAGIVAAVNVDAALRPGAVEASAAAAPVPDAAGSAAPAPLEPADAAGAPSDGPQPWAPEGRAP